VFSPDTAKVLEHPPYGRALPPVPRPQAAPATEESALARSRTRLTATALATVLAAGGLAAAAPAVADTPATPARTAEACTAADLVDNRPGSSFYRAVRWLQCEGITTGYADGTYRKDRDINRAEAMGMLFRYALPHDTYSRSGEVPSFTDVPSGSSFHDAISWAGVHRITVGRTDGSFDRNAPVTRAEFAAFAYRWVDPEGRTAPDTSPFPDMDPSSNHFEAVAWMQDNDIVTGYTDGRYQPSRHITRGEMAAVLARLDTHIDPHGTTPAEGCVGPATPVRSEEPNGPKRGTYRTRSTVHLTRTVEPGDCLTFDPLDHEYVPEGYDNLSLLGSERARGADDGLASTRANADGTLSITVDEDYWDRYGARGVYVDSFVAWKDDGDFVVGSIHLNIAHPDRGHAPYLVDDHVEAEAGEPVTIDPRANDWLSHGDGTPAFAEDLAVVPDVSPRGGEPRKEHETDTAHIRVNEDLTVTLTPKDPGPSSTSILYTVPPSEHANRDEGATDARALITVSWR
jgi:hypothetical protein